MAIKKNHSGSLLILIILLVGFAFGGFLDARGYGLSFFEEKERTVYIDEQQDLEDMGGSFHNNTCFLTKDITLSSIGDLASNDFPYVATFDGQGHTIRLQGDVQNSLFGYIGKGGVVKNLTLVIDYTTLLNSKFASLAIKNEGTIVNCKVVVANMIVKKVGVYAGVVAYNHGLIKNVWSNCSFEKNLSNEEWKNDKMGAIKAGGICAFNYGEVDSSVALTAFRSFYETGKSEQYGSASSNSYIGALIGSDNGKGKVKNCLASVAEDVYPSDQKNTGLTFLTQEELYTEEKLFEQLKFSRDRWLLVQQQNVYDFNIQQGDNE